MNLHLVSFLSQGTERYRILSIIMYYMGYFYISLMCDVQGTAKNPHIKQDHVLTSSDCNIKL